MAAIEREDHVVLEEKEDHVVWGEKGEDHAVLEERKEDHVVLGCCLLPRGLCSRRDFARKKRG